MYYICPRIHSITKRIINKLKYLNLMKQIYLKFSMLLLCLVVGLSSAWGETKTVKLTNANIVAAGQAKTGYQNWKLQDEASNEWNAYAIKYYHSNATNDRHFLQIKKNASNTAYYLQIPQLGTRITKIEMVVSSTNKDMDSGENTATLLFSEKNSTSASGTGVASGDGKNKITIDASALNLNTGYITSTAAVRIWAVTVTYEDDGTAVIPEQYSYTLETIGEGSAVFKDESGNEIKPGDKVNKDTKITPTFTPSDGYEFTNWEYYTTNNEWSTLNINTPFTITKDVKFRVTFKEKATEPDTPEIPGGNFTIVCKDVEWKTGDNTLSTTNSGFNVLCEKNTGTTAPAYNDNGKDVRVYAIGTITIYSDNNSFDKVVFNISTAGLKRLAPISANIGTINSQNSGDKTVTWSNSTPVNSVTFTVGDIAIYGTENTKAGQLDFTSIDITAYVPEEPTPEKGTLNLVATTGNSNYYATFSSTRDVIFPAGEGWELYTVAVDDDELVMIDLNNNSLSAVTDKTKDEGWVAGYYVQANTGVLIYSLETTVDYYFAEDDEYNIRYNVETDEEYNMLKASSVAMAGNYEFFKLAYDSNRTNLGFYYGAEEGAAFQCKEGTAYLAVPVDKVPTVKSFVLADKTTSIKNISSTLDENAPIYNLSGQRVNSKTKGILIQNGKKFINM